jgi:hypothetical protein
MISWWLNNKMESMTGRENFVEIFAGEVYNLNQLAYTWHWELFRYRKFCTWNGDRTADYSERGSPS